MRRNKYYVNVMNEKDREMIRVHLNKLDSEILKDDTSEDNKEEIEQMLSKSWFIST